MQMIRFGFIEILLPLTIMLIAIGFGIGYKLINKSATLNDPVEQEVIKVVEEEAQEILQKEMPNK